MNSRILVRCVLAAAFSAISMSSAKAVSIEDKPFVKVTPIYGKGVTSIDGKAINFIDQQHQYIGITIGCERTVYEFSGNCYITDGNGHYLTPELIYPKRDVTENIMQLFKGDKYDAEKTTSSIESVDFQDQYSNGTLFYTDDPTDEVVWEVTLSTDKSYYTIYSPYKHAYLAVFKKIWEGQEQSDPRMYLTSDANDVNTHWQINKNSQIYQNRKNNTTYFALHYHGSDGNEEDRFFQVEDNQNMLDRNVVENQIIPIRAAVFSSYVAGILDTETIIQAIKDKLAISNDKYAYTNGSAENLCKGLLYVDMSGLQEVTIKNTETWKTFQDECSVNCLFFMPETFNANNGTFTKNVVAKKGAGYEAKSDFVLTDIDTSYGDDYINPFFSKYTFDVKGDYKAKYERVLDSQDSQTSTIILPFPVKLNAFGYSTSDTDTRFFTIGSENSNPILGLFKLCTSFLTNKQAYANTPYHVQMAHGHLDIEETETTVLQTEVREYENNMGDWVAYGNYFGKLQQKSIEGGTQYYYYTNGAYVNSSFRKSTFYADPYRVYFTPNKNQCAKSYSLVFDEDDEDATGIESATTEETSTSEEIYTLSGVKVNGKPQHGIYIVNGKKKMF